MIGADDPEVDRQSTRNDRAASMLSATMPLVHGTNTVSPDAAIPENAPPADVPHTGALADSPTPRMEYPGRTEAFMR